jgi:hypothetical protein
MGTEARHTAFLRVKASRSNQVRIKQDLKLRTSDEFRRHNFPQNLTYSVNQLRRRLLHHQ